jgi:hypothetical protein
MYRLDVNPTLLFPGLAPLCELLHAVSGCQGKDCKETCEDTACDEIVACYYGNCRTDPDPLACAVRGALASLRENIVCWSEIYNPDLPLTDRKRGWQFAKKCLADFKARNPSTKLRSGSSTSGFLQRPCAWSGATRSRPVLVHGASG